MEELKHKGMNSNSQYMRFVVDFHNMMVDKKITLAYEGEVTQEITKAFTSMTERNLEKVEENGKIKKKVYHVMVECLQNISKQHHMNTASQILQQLGGNKFIAMTGAACFQDNGKLVVKFKGSQKANLMHVTLREDDTYNVTIMKYRGLNIKVVKEVEGAYADMLCPIFEKATGLKTSL